MQTHTFIYCLLDPRDGKPRYVGKANNLERRYKAHCNLARFKNTHKFNWIRKLKKSNLKPKLIILEQVPIESWKSREKHWIKYFLKRGYKLVNYTNGGDGLNFGNQTSFKKGHTSWNKSKGNTEKCTVCNKEFKASKSSKRKFCSRTCYQQYRKDNNIGMQTLFQKGNVSWNKGKKNIISKKRIPVLQYDLEGNFIKEYSHCKEAAKVFSCGIENIRNATKGRSKTAKGFIWKYKNIN